METNANYSNQIRKTSIEIFQESLKEEKQSCEGKFGYKIINIVALGILTHKGKALNIDFEKLGQSIEIREIKRFPSVQFKANGRSLSLFKNGKIIFTGIKNEEILYELKDEAEKILRSSHLEFDTFELKVQNLVTITNLEKMVDLEIL